MKIAKWVNSVRAWALVLIILGLLVGLLIGKITGEQYIGASMVVLTGFFARPKSETNSRGEIVE